MKNFSLLILLFIGIANIHASNGKIDKDSLKASIKEWKDSIRTDIEQYRDSVDESVKAYKDSIKTSMKEWKASGKPATKDWSQPDVYYLKNNKLVQKIDGKIIDVNSKQTLSNGSTVNTKGLVKMANGKTTQLKNGDSINKEGVITKYNPANTNKMDAQD